MSPYNWCLKMDMCQIVNEHSMVCHVMILVAKKLTIKINPMNF
jgi:hypothetical protein